MEELYGERVWSAPPPPHMLVSTYDNTRELDLGPYSILMTAGLPSHISRVDKKMWTKVFGRKSSDGNLHEDQGTDLTRPY